MAVCNLLYRRHHVREQATIEVVYLLLDTAGVKPIGILFVLIALEVLEANSNPCGPTGIDEDPPPLQLPRAR